MKKIKQFGFGLYSKFILSVTIPTLITAVMFFSYFIHTMIIRERDNIDMVLESISQTLELQFQEIMNIGDTIYINNDIFRLLEAINNPMLMEGVDDLELNRLDNNYSMSMIKLMYLASSDIVDVLFVPMDSNDDLGYFIDKRHGELKEMLYPDYKSSSWFKEGLKAEGSPIFYGIHEPFYRKSTRTNKVFSCVRAIKNMDNRRIVGVLKVDVAESAFDKALESGLGNLNGLYVLNKERVMYSTEGITRDISVLENDGYAMIEGKLCYMKTIDLDPTGWSLGYILYLSRDLKYMIIAILIFLFIFVLENYVALSMFRLKAGDLVTDVEKITDALLKIENGEECPCLELCSSEEIARIGEAVKQLSINLKTYIEKEYVWALEQKKAEFRALQSKINPHFLYNTLNGFIALNRMGESDKLEKGIINLTKILRYTCQSGDETTIDRVCEVEREYLELEKLKYEDRLEYDIQIDDGTHGFVLPKLILQPLVENAIVHGMGDTDKPIHISIKCELLPHCVRISVSDDGTGFDQSVLEDPVHTGLNNVFERIRIFSPDVVVNLNTEIGMGTRITFTFPGGAKC